MKYIAYIIICSLLLSSCQQASYDGEGMVGVLPAQKAAYQKAIVGQLSGHEALPNGLKIKSRWSSAERGLSKDYLKELITTLGLEAQEQPYTAPNLNPAIDLILDPFQGTNVYAILPATNNSSDYIVLGGHYDSGKRNAPGAIDNATGIALIYSVAKELSKWQHRNKNIVIVFFDQEEEELIGSTAFAKLLQEKPWNVHSIHCFDMVGWDGDKDRAMEIFSGSASLIETYKTLAQEQNVPIKDIKIDPVGYDNSSTDFDVFVPFGFNVIGAGECFYHRDSSPYKDTPDDTYETVDFEYLLSCSNLIERIIKKMVSE